MKNKTVHRDKYSGSINDKYEIKINDSETINVYTDKYTANDAVCVALSQFNDDYDIYCNSDTLNNISINRKEPDKASLTIAMAGLLVDIGTHVQFKQDGKTVTLNRVFKT